MLDDAVGIARRALDATFASLVALDRAGAQP
jgi:hypothetical protein